MKSRHITWMIWIMYLVAFLCACNASSSSGFLLGCWSSRFPMGDGFNGYAFFENGEFIFADSSPSNLDYRFIGSSGSWKIKGNLILIRIAKHFYFRNEIPRINKPGQLFDVTGNQLRALSVNDKWVPIGQINNYPQEWAEFVEAVRNAHEKLSVLQRPFLQLNTIHRGMLGNPGRYFFVATLKNQIYDITMYKGLFSKAAQGNIREWAPETSE